MDLTELIESIDIAEYIGQYVDLEEKNGELWGISPFTSPPEKTPSFSVRPESGTFYDFSSGIGGSLFTFIQFFHKKTKKEVVEELKRYAGVDGALSGGEKLCNMLNATTIAKRFIVKKVNKKENKIAVLSPTYMERFEDRPDKLEVWRKEGITDEAMRFFGVKYDSFSNCIVYPIKNEHGDIVNVGGRTLEPNFKERGIRKYTYFKPWGGQMSVIYGLSENFSEIKAKNEIILFEGMKSVLLARGYGFKNCGAILTSHLNPGQMKILARLGVRVTFALDKDVDVTKDHNAQILKQYNNIYYLYDFKNLTGAKDAPVDKGEAVFRQLYTECRRKL